MDRNLLRSLFIDPAYDDSRMGVPLAVHSLGRALVLAPRQPGGFGRADVKRVERYSEFFDADFTNNAYVVELKDGRRFFLEYSCDDSTEARCEHLEIEQIPESFDDGPITLTPTSPGLSDDNQRSWCDDVDHLNEALAAG